MRVPSLMAPLAVLALLTGTLTAAPAVAEAPKPTELATITIPDLPPPVSGETAPFFTALYSPLGGSNVDSVEGVPVELWIRPAGQATFTKAAEVITGSLGDAHVDVAVVRNTSAYWVFRGNATYGPSQSTGVLQLVATKVTRRINDRTLRKGQRLVVRGTTFPVKPGHTISLWQGTIPGHWVQDRPKLLKKATVRSDGTYRLRKRLYTSGKKQLFVQVSRGGGNTVGYSRYIRVRVG